MIEIVENEIVVEVVEAPEIVIEVGDGPILPDWGMIGGDIENQCDLMEELDLLWGEINGKADRVHHHDNRYYSKEDVNSLLSDKADADDVYTKQETDAALANKADSDDVYNKAQMDIAFAGKVNSEDMIAALALKANQSDVEAELAEKADSDEVAEAFQLVNAALSQKADKSGVYSKQEMDAALADKADADDVYTKQETDAALADKADKSAVYTKLETDAALADKADADDVYTKQETDAALADKADKSGVYSKQETDSALAGKSDTDHNHDGVYSALNHNHDGRYYLKAETDDLLSGKADGIVCEVSGRPVHVSDASGVPVLGLSVRVEAMQSGSGVPSAENIRPFLGWTGVRITRAHEFLPYDVFAGGIAGSSGTGRVTTAALNTWSVICAVEPGKRYTLRKILSNRCRLGFTESYPVNNAQCYSVTTVNSAVVMEFTAPENCFYLICMVGVSEPNVENVLDSVLIYETDGGSSVSMDFPVSAGTVYGGALDVVSGVLRVTHGYIGSYGGEVLPGEWASDRDEYAAGSVPSMGAEVVYVLSSPVVYELIGADMVLFLGENSIGADAGPVSMRYRADTKLYIDGKFAELQALVLENG